MACWLDGFFGGCLGPLLTGVLDDGTLSGRESLATDFLSSLKRRLGGERRGDRRGDGRAAGRRSGERRRGELLGDLADLELRGLTERR